jgi:hypothetical protein
MTEPIRNLRNESSAPPPKGVLPKSPTFDYVLAKGGIPKVGTVVAALKAEFGECSKGIRLGGDTVREYADVYRIDLNDRACVLKLVHPSGQMSFDTAVDLLNQDKVALSARLPNMPHYLGALRDRDGYLVATVATFVEGTPLHGALTSGTIEREEATAKLVQTLSGFFAQKFHLIDHHAENFLLTPTREIVLVDGGALSRREMLIERYGDFEACEIQIINSAFFEERGETIRKLTLRDIAALVLDSQRSGQ